MKPYSKFILDSMLWIPRQEIRDLDRAKKLLTVASRFDKSVQIETFIEREDFFGVPRNYFDKDYQNLASEIIDNRSEGSKSEWSLACQFWPGQREVLQAFADHLFKGKSHFTLQAPPGFGKTVCLIMMLKAIGRTALVIVPKSDLVNQWRKELLVRTDLSEDRIGTVAGRIADWQQKDIVIGLIHTLVLNKLGDDFNRRFGVIVADEADRSVPPETFAPSLALFPAKYRIAASATLRRPDGLHKVFNLGIGGVLVKGQNLNRMTAQVLVVNYECSSGYIHMESERMKRRGMLISRLAFNPSRNFAIAHYTDKMHRTGRRVAVLSDRIAQLEWIKKFLIIDFKTDPAKIGFYADQIPVETDKRGKVIKKRKSKPEELVGVLKNSSIILATYNMMGVGTDIPDLAGLVFGTPQSFIEQKCGRVERMMEGKQQPLIVDIVDLKYEDAVAWAKRRVRYYKKHNMKIKSVKG